MYHVQSTENINVIRCAPHCQGVQSLQGTDQKIIALLPNKYSVQGGTKDHMGAHRRDILFGLGGQKRLPRRGEN